MWRAFTRVFWFTIALIFVVEAWLWDRLEPIVEYCVALLPLQPLKQWISRHVEAMSPSATLTVFTIPAAMLFPLKLVAVWFIAHEQWLAAGVTVLFAKLLGLAVTSFLFAVTRDKLLQMEWFRAIYDKLVEWREMAHQLTEPFRIQLQRVMQQFGSEHVARFWRAAMRLRRKTQTVR